MSRYINIQLSMASTDETLMPVVDEVFAAETEIESSASSSVAVEQSGQTLDPQQNINDDVKQIEHAWQIQRTDCCYYYYCYYYYICSERR